MEITKDETKFECPNGHPVHQECLREWLIHSLNCPLCNEPYSADIIAKSKEYIERKEKEKRDFVDDQLKRERNEKIKKIADKFVFLKSIDTIKDLTKEQEFDAALERLRALEGKELSDFKNQTIFFLLGKIYFLQGRYDMAIGHLFKLVKEKYDYPKAFLYLGKAYQKLGLDEKAKWAFDRVKKK